MLCCAELHSFQGLFLCHESSCTVCYCSAHSSLLEGGVDILKHKGTVAAFIFVSSHSDSVSILTI